MKRRALLDATNMMRTLLGGLLALTVSVTGGPDTPVSAQAQTAQAPLEKLGPGLYRLRSIRVDTNTREVSVPGRLNNVEVLEFVANTPSGFKAYESALTLDTDAVSFNAALLLIGLDKSRSRVPTRHFDEVAPEGDKVELWLDTARDNLGRMRVEQLLFDLRTNRTLPEGPWVYTGSTILHDGRYAADVDGVLIGFVHSPGPVIENPRAAGVNGYGSIVLNPNLLRLGLAPRTPLTLIVRALPRASPSYP